MHPERRQSCPYSLVCPDQTFDWIELGKLRLQNVDFQILLSTEYQPPQANQFDTMSQPRGVQERARGTLRQK